MTTLADPENHPAWKDRIHLEAFELVDVYPNGQKVYGSDIGATYASRRAAEMIANQMNRQVPRNHVYVQPI